MSSIRYLGGCDATYVSERELMLVESLVKATVELQGFRVESVTGATSGWWRWSLRICDLVRAAGSVWNPRGIGTRVRFGGFAMCRCGGSRWSFATSRGG